jgi:glycosyltransferase involved in cell wall biosynthesis
VRHLIICPEYPPAPIPPGGIGAYVHHISKLLAEAGETVHVIGPLWEGAPKPTEEACSGRLVIHRVSHDAPLRRGVDRAVSTREATGLLQSDFWRQCFSWQAGLLAEILVDEAGIDVIESQEYDAPLYYFLLRRALGAGPKRQPPCVTHLHSPTEFIARNNGWDALMPDYLIAKRLEDFIISTADTLLCPSRYLARNVEEHYGLGPNSVSVIPLPIGDTPVIERAGAVWSEGSICYFGRLEPRKGVIEWVDAAVAVADEHPSAQFEFIGADLPYTSGLTVRQHVESKIPDRLKPRFHFRGSKPRAELSRFLGQARMAVVPSRWENFPYTCVEAMCSGIPVIVSPEGGMAEMIRDGETGWLADNARSDGLAVALRRALAALPSRIEEMGRQAAIDIRRKCDNGKIVQSHIDFRKRVLDRGANRSLRLPVNLPWAPRPLSYESARRVPRSGSAKGLAFIVDGFNGRGSIDNCLKSIEQQTRAPAAAVLITDSPHCDNVRKALRSEYRVRWEVCEGRSGSPAKAKNEGIETALSTGADPLAFVFLDAADRLDPRFAETCESVFRHCPEVGLVSSWMQREGKEKLFVIRPCPAFPYQLLSDETVPATAVRTEALREAGLFRAELNSGFERWDLVNAVMASDWMAVTFPALLTGRAETPEGTSRPSMSAEHGRMRREMLARFPDVVARDSLEIVHLLESRIFQVESSIRHDTRQPFFAAGVQILRPSDFFRLTLAEQIVVAGKAVRDPIGAIWHLAWHTRRALERVGQRLPGIFTRGAR